MTQASAYFLILLFAALLFTDANWYDWKYTIWAAQHFIGFVEYLKFWR